MTYKNYKQVFEMWNDVKVCNALQNWMFKKHYCYGLNVIISRTCYNWELVRKDDKQHTDYRWFLNEVVEMNDFMCKSTSMVYRKNEQKDRQTMLIDCIVNRFLGWLHLDKPPFGRKGTGVELKLCVKLAKFVKYYSAQMHSNSLFCVSIRML